MKSKIWGLLCVAVVCFLSPSEAEASRRRNRCSDELNQARTKSHGQSQPPNQPSNSPTRQNNSLGSQRRLEEISVLNLITYNLLNLEMHVGKFERGATGLHQLKGPRKKEDVFREQQAKLLLEEKMDLGVFQEVEGKESFLAFNEIYLNGQFDPLMVKGNDPRGIQIGMYLKHDLPFEIEYRSHVARTWVDPISQHKQRVFTRDLPTLIVRAKGDKKPLVVFIGTHYKSKRDRDDDPESEILRKAQADATVEIINALKRELGEAVPIILAGDFNGNYNKEEAFANMRKALDMDDPFNDLNVSNHDRVTHTYHPRDAETKWNQVDYLLVSRNIKACIKSAYVHRYKDAAGKIKPLPNTYEERKQNPSDHFPVVMQLDFQCLLKYWRNN